MISPKRIIAIAIMSLNGIFLLSIDNVTTNGHSIDVTNVSVELKNYEHIVSLTKHGRWK